MTWPIPEGHVLAAKYEVEKCLGAGGMGMVLLARHLELGQRVAIKLMHPDIARNGEAVARFIREGRAAVRLRSPHVARVLDVGRLESGEPYLVMEYLEGKDLAALVAERGPLPLPEVAAYLLQACEAVAEAHAVGIVHRDLKPANLFLTWDPYGQPAIKVLDFGISKLSDDAMGRSNAGSMTATSVVMGSPFYMPPEQMRSARSADGRSDIWALGVILWELLTGRPVWQAATMSEICVRVATDPTPSIFPIRPDLPPALDRIIATCLEKDPERRYQRIVDFCSALAPFAGASAAAMMERIIHLSGTGRQSPLLPAGAMETGSGVQATGPGTPAPTPSPSTVGRGHPGAASVEAPGTAVAWGAQRTDAPRFGSLRAKLAVAISLLLVVAGGVLWQLGRHSPSPLAGSSASTPAVEASEDRRDTALAPPVVSYSAAPSVLGPSGNPPAPSAVHRSSSPVPAAVVSAQRPRWVVSTGQARPAQSDAKTPESPAARAPLQPTSRTPDWGGRQ